MHNYHVSEILQLLVHLQDEKQNSWTNLAFIKFKH